MLSYSTAKNKPKAIRQLVQTLCIFYFEDVTSRELDVLCEIVHAGEVGYDSKTAFMLNYKASKESYFQVIDSGLRNHNFFLAMLVSLSNAYSWLTGRLKDDKLSNCTACSMCSIYFKTAEKEEICPKGKWKILE